MSARESSTNKCSSSSVVFGDQPVSDPTDELLKRLSKKEFDVDLLQVLEQNPSVSFGIKDLLKQINILTTPLEIADVILELGLLIDEITPDFNRMWEALIKIHNKMETQLAEWDDASESTNKVTKLEQSLEQNKEEFETCANNITSWEQQIEELQTKIQKAKERQKEIHKLYHSELETEIQVGVHHVEQTQTLEKEINVLNSNKNVLDRHLSLSKTKYTRMKALPL